MSGTGFSSIVLDGAPRTPGIEEQSDSGPPSVAWEMMARFLARALRRLIREVTGDEGHDGDVRWVAHYLRPGSVAGHVVRTFVDDAGATGVIDRVNATRETVPLGLSPDETAAVAAFTTRGRVPGSSRALGWDTMLPSSSCGTQMTTSAFGHVGFTGTSLWIDPERDRYFVLLTNRVCGGGTIDQMREVRRAFHDAIT